MAATSDDYDDDDDCTRADNKSARVQFVAQAQWPPVAVPACAPIWFARAPLAQACVERRPLAPEELCAKHRFMRHRPSARHGRVRVRARERASRPTTRSERPAPVASRVSGFGRGALRAAGRAAPDGPIRSIWAPNGRRRTLFQQRRAHRVDAAAAFFVTHTHSHSHERLSLSLYSTQSLCVRH